LKRKQLKAGGAGSLAGSQKPEAEIKMLNADQLVT